MDLSSYLVDTLLRDGDGLSMANGVELRVPMLGRRLVEKRNQVKIFGVKRDRRARVEVLNGFSAHAGRSSLIEYAKLAGPDTKKVFLVHGEEKAQESLAEALHKRNMTVEIPDRCDIKTL